MHLTHFVVDATNRGRRLSEMWWNRTGARAGQGDARRRAPIIDPWEVR